MAALADVLKPAEAELGWLCEHGVRSERTFALAGGHAARNQIERLYKQARGSFAVLAPLELLCDERLQPLFARYGLELALGQTKGYGWFCHGLPLRAITFLTA